MIKPYFLEKRKIARAQCEDRRDTLKGRVKALEDCCETATEELADHEERISSAENDIDTLQEDLMSAQSDIQSNTDAIDSIERLPEVTSADDGKVLTVVDGKWGIEPSSLVGEAIVGQSTVGGGNNIFDTFYPVGSYYETSDASFDPNTAWGGTWNKDTNSSPYRWHRTA